MNRIEGISPPAWATRRTSSPGRGPSGCRQSSPKKDAPRSINGDGSGSHSAWATSSMAGANATLTAAGRVLPGRIRTALAIRIRPADALSATTNHGHRPMYSVRRDQILRSPHAIARKPSFDTVGGRGAQSTAASESRPASPSKVALGNQTLDPLVHRSARRQGPYAGHVPIRGKLEVSPKDGPNLKCRSLLNDVE